MSFSTLTPQSWLSRHAQFRPSHPAFKFQNLSLTFGELQGEVHQICQAFQSWGLQPGDKVATLLPNTRELFEIYWACAQFGAVAVPLSPLLRGEGLVSLIKNSNAKLLILDEDSQKHLENVKSQLGKISTWVAGEFFAKEKAKYSWKNFSSTPVSHESPYNIIYSSGTTGLPKGIVLSQSVRALYGLLFASAFRMTPESVVLHSGSIIFNGAFLTLMPAMFLGCTYVLEDHFDPEKVIESLHQNKVTHTILVPSQIMACLQHPLFNAKYLPHLEYVLSVGAPLLLEHKQKLNERLPGVFYELYGLTEGFMTILDKNDSLKEVGSVGFPAPFMEMKICNDQGEELPQGQIGEIVGRGPLLMTEYYNNPEQTREALRDGWLYTGDLGYVDKKGFLYLTGRKKDLIISGGVNVYPVDIEQVLAQHPNVKDVAVFGAPHKEWGETPVAAVVTNSESITANELKEWANSRLHARFQKIDKVVLKSELPRNVAGKVLKKQLLNEFFKSGDLK